MKKSTRTRQSKATMSLSSERSQLKSIEIEKESILSPKGTLSLKNLRSIVPDEWNNVPIPVTQSIKTII